MRYCILLTGLLVSANLFSQTKFLMPADNKVECETKEQREAYKMQLKTLKAAYYASPKDSISSTTMRAGHPLFAWPMRVSGDYEMASYNYFNVQNYTDQNGSDPGYIDYHCSTRTYDGHDAADINLWPFWWHIMDNSYVAAIAAAPGIILHKNDGNFDRNCTKVGSPNSVTILHSDGTTTRYLHLKEGSLTTKPELASVVEGEFLGYIGSSGHSSNPHLHFAVYDNNSNLIEPFFDASYSACNVYNQETWWQDQRSYWEPQINKVMTHSFYPSIGFCTNEEAMNGKNNFNSGDVVYTGIAFQDGQNGDVANCKLVAPSGLDYTTWSVTLNTTNSRIYASDVFALPSGNAGTWTFRVTYRGKTYKHFFSVGCVNSETVSGTISGTDGHITGNFINSVALYNGAAGSKVLYQAANYIDLKPGFEVQSGVSFKGRIKPCSYVE
jgi:Peptidase family M23